MDEISFTVFIKNTVGDSGKFDKCREVAKAKKAGYEKAESAFTDDVILSLSIGGALHRIFFL